MKAKMGEPKEIDDGRKDCCISVNGVKTFIFTEEGMKALGISYDDGKVLVAAITQMLVNQISQAGAR
ncbi:MAG: hypothetical protein A2X97_14075 [Bdellovibrionales bacterium GWA1_52_35]|nr:MAG: hypothetical protein A2X97_14075 [Bdellovibrionales bacterium GWA1_52_35]